MNYQWNITLRLNDLQVCVNELHELCRIPVKRHTYAYHMIDTVIMTIRKTMEADEAFLK